MEVYNPSVPSWKFDTTLQQITEDLQMGKSTLEEASLEATMAIAERLELLCLLVDGLKRHVDGLKRQLSP